MFESLQFLTTLAITLFIYIRSRAGPPQEGEEATRGERRRTKDISIVN